MIHDYSTVLEDGLGVARQMPFACGLFSLNLLQCVNLVWYKCPVVIVQQGHYQGKPSYPGSYPIDRELQKQSKDKKKTPFLKMPFLSFKSKTYVISFLWKVLYNMGKKKKKNKSEVSISFLYLGPGRVSYKACW